MRGKKHELAWNGPELYGDVVVLAASRGHNDEPLAGVLAPALLQSGPVRTQLLRQDATLAGLRAQEGALRPPTLRLLRLLSPRGHTRR